MSRFNICNRKVERGFSLVELMVSMVIGLIILAAVSTILANSNKNYHTTDSMARLQENARFAMQFIGTDLRRAGYVGCADDIESITSTVNGGGLGGLGTAMSSLEGANNLVAAATNTLSPSGNLIPVTPIANTDAFAIRYLDNDNPIAIQQPMPQESAALFVNSGHGLQEGDIIAVSDCDSADVMQLTNIQDSGTSGKDNLVHNAGVSEPGNSTQKLSKTYDVGAVVLKLGQYGYYIGTGASGQRALIRLDISKALANPANPASMYAQELVEGIEDMQLTYGEVTTGDRVPSIYRTASSVTNWNNVISVRVGILAGTVANTDDGQYGTTVDTGTYMVNDRTFDGVTDGGSQRRIRKVFTATYMLRNLK